MNIVNWKGAGVVIMFELTDKKFILVGKETRYLSDYNNTINNPSIFNSPSLKESEIYNIFTLKAKEIGNIDIFTDQPKHVFITYDKPILQNNYWSANYRILPRNKDKIFFGVPKGGKLLCDDRPMDTVIRECEEEIGYKMDENRLEYLGTEKGYVFYIHKISYIELDKIKRDVKERLNKNIGELQDIQFMELQEIKQRIDEFNGLTKKIINEYI